MSEENKFNFSEEEKKDADLNAEQKAEEKAAEDSKKSVKDDAKGLFESVKAFLIELLDFRSDTDRDATIAAIKADIPFKGATAWILICSIFVASIGLNANSTAVVIGAMLISPLMGPILGIGLSIAINDIDTLKRSLINLATMLILSLLTAYLFFEFFPLSEDTSELLGRTRPDIRDVLIAFFGGLALIIARTKKGTIASVIFGVAIATALMPPLCTAGYGLAKGNWSYFSGAMYLFSINTIFIALATFLVLKILRFPMLKYANSAKRKRISQFASLVAIVVMIPAAISFYTVLQESKYEMSYKNFIENEIDANDDLWLQRKKLDIDDKKISLYFNGEMSDAIITSLRNELKTGTDYNNIKDFELIINSNETRSVDRMSESLDRAYANLDRKDNVIHGLQSEIEALQATVKSLNLQMEKKVNPLGSISFTTLAKDAKIKFRHLEYFGYSKMLETKDFIKVDTVSVIDVEWSKQLHDSVKVRKEKELKEWLRTTVKTDSILVKKHLR
ncbi:DUF389 domain-containing protein [Bizionia paragorgiae]|uniref:Uncharacterized hydrophobic domain-containing protein n=1 Tax=Bizionia paragorgiae TaxID=283786 RepID=A0A1H3Z7S1_BIZPA|nr:DUF389 domain-containing protein [Bizionia paragorgiae]MDX1271997.1 DUF389 domain-containing protein [Bizionia paragorgiae]SEA19873.1 uncharacterized hydrophobic domain-containing protein [Bizionia paragorgiae]